jgi:hypothetical protein
MNNSSSNRPKVTLETARAILAFCEKYNAECVTHDNTYHFVVPGELSADAKKEITGILKGMALTSFIGPKFQTRDSIDSIINRIDNNGGSYKTDIEHRSMTIVVDGVNEDRALINSLSCVLKNDGFFDSWKLVINGIETKVFAGVIDEMAKNNTRTASIREENITDLKIALANAITADDLLAAIENI